MGGALRRPGSKGGCELKTTELVESLLRETVEAMGFSLCDVEFQKEHGNWVLTLYIDREGGVDLNDCERVSRAVDPILDEADPIEQHYYLSVSSLGLDRPLKKDADFARNLGKELVVRLYAPQDGKRNGSVRCARSTLNPLNLRRRTAGRGGSCAGRRRWFGRTSGFSR